VRLQLVDLFLQEVITINKTKSMDLKKAVNDRETVKLSLSPLILGTSGLGKLFVALDEKTKYEIIKECLQLSNGGVVFDSAGKYGACLRRIN